MIAVSFLAGLGFALAFPRAGLVPFAWFAPVPWLVLLSRVGAARGFRLGLAFGAGFFGLLLGWVHAVLAHYTSLPLLLTVPIWLLLVAYLAAYTAAFGAIVAGLCGRVGRGALLAAPVLWVGIEFVRGRVLGGFPWGSAGYARTGGLALSQAASIGGEALVSFLLVAAWSAIALLVPGSQTPRRADAERLERVPAGAGRWPKVERALALGAVAMVGGAVLLGAFRLRLHPIQGEGVVTENRSLPATPKPVTDRELRIMLVQGGFGGDLDYEDGKRALRTYSDLSLLAAGTGQDLVVWPESNAPYLPEDTPGYLETLSGLVRALGCPLLLGGVGGSEQEGLTNSAFLVGIDGVRFRYDKRRLVQYGEYVPLKTLFPFIRHFVAEVGEFRPGSAVGVMPLGRRRLGVSICYEMIFPEEILLQVRAGAEMLINITNDSWYRWGGPWQHADFSTLRAIESGLYVARAASTGRTLLIDPLGRTVTAGPLSGEAILCARVPIAQSPEHRGATLFVLWGEWVGKGCATLTAMVLAFLAVRNAGDRSLARGGRRRRGAELVQ